MFMERLWIGCQLDRLSGMAVVTARDYIQITTRGHITGRTGVRG
jgi:hypothetical protein